ncbi:collagen triple helix repeat-containing protein 1-like [Amphiura filiformis]|uniref:collagen triple helix repeat-containing protein 1-like n=1 Tax=Amphiura filiformis TaxID=82378 RepID=UPI003B226920
MTDCTAIATSFFTYLCISLAVFPFIFGIKCTDGPRGPQGPPGPQGVTGDLTKVEWFENWRQCAWRSGNGADYGEIGSCTITKQKSDSALYVTYGANMRVYGCHGCCKRWYITFNGAECSPIPIDGAVYQTNTNNMNLLRHRNIGGYCMNIAAGSVVVRAMVGDCSGYGNYDAESGWNSASRIIVREVPKSPYD